MMSGFVERVINSPQTLLYGKPLLVAHYMLQQIVGLSVRLSVCLLSVTIVNCVKLQNISNYLTAMNVVTRRKTTIG